LIIRIYIFSKRFSETVTLKIHVFSTKKKNLKTPVHQDNLISL